MQNITVVYQDEEGKVLEQLPINFVDVFSAMPGTYEENKGKFPWAFSINPYGDTYFNVLQWPYLVEELSRLKDIVTNKNAKNIIVGIINFLHKKEVKADFHICLVFVGD